EGLLDRAAAPEIKRNGSFSAPLSFGQTRLWFFEQIEPGTATYNMPGGLVLKGVLSVVALERALLDIVRRQESLRTWFQEAAGEGLQIIEPVKLLYLDASRYTPGLIDVSDLLEPERSETVQLMARDEAVRPFALGRAPLFRVSLVRVTSNHHIL